MKREGDTRAARQLTMSLDNELIGRLQEAERAEAIRLIAELLLEACGGASEENRDEDI